MLVASVDRAVEWQPGDNDGFSLSLSDSHGINYERVCKCKMDGDAVFSGFHCFSAYRIVDEFGKPPKALDIVRTGIHGKPEKRWSITLHLLNGQHTRRLKRKSSDGEGN